MTPAERIVLFSRIFKFRHVCRRVRNFLREQPRDRFRRWAAARFQSERIRFFFYNSPTRKWRKTSFAKKKKRVRFLFVLQPSRNRPFSRVPPSPEDVRTGLRRVVESVVTSKEPRAVSILFLSYSVNVYDVTSPRSRRRTLYARSRVCVYITSLYYSIIKFRAHVHDTCVTRTTTHCVLIIIIIITAHASS